MMKYPTGGKNGLIKAIDFLKEAIHCDTTYLLAYRNLAHAYDWDHDYKNELSVYSKALDLSHNYPTIITEKAEVFEKMGMLDSARRTYQSAHKSFNDSLSIHPKNVQFVRGILLVIALTEGKESAVKELNRRCALYPELRSEMVSDFDFYQFFDKRSYLYHLTQ